MQKATPTRNVAPMEVPALPNAPGVKGGRECSMCRTDRRMCDGGRPCTRCVTYGFQCRDVRKRGRPKKDQEDKSLVVQDHPLFSEWAIGGGGKKAPEPPRKRRRQSSAKSANTQSITAPMDKSPTDDLKSAPKGSVAPSDQLPSLSYASATSISCQYKSPAMHTDESQLRSHSQQPYYMQQSQQQPYSNYPPQQKSYSQPPTPETSESLEQQLQRYRQQYRMHVAGLAEKSSISTELRNLYSHPSQRTDYSTQQQQQQQPPQQQQQQQQQQQKQKQGYEGTHEQQPAIPFLNCIQELLKITPDMKPSSVMMKEEVVCIDSVQMNPSTKQHKSSPISPPQTQQKYPPPQGSPPQYPGLHHSLPPYPSHYAPPSYPSHHQYHPFHRGYSLPPQSLSAYPSHHPYYPPPSGPSLQDEEDDRDSSSQSRNDEPRKSYPSFNSERRSAWDFAMPPPAGGDSRARLGGSANATGSSSCPPPSNSTSSLLRLLTYED